MRNPRKVRNANHSRGRFCQCKAADTMPSSRTGRERTRHREEFRRGQFRASNSCIAQKICVLECAFEHCDTRKGRADASTGALAFRPTRKGLHVIHDFARRAHNIPTVRARTARRVAWIVAVLLVGVAATVWFVLREYPASAGQSTD
jgi:hypothetical protein